MRAATTSTEMELPRVNRSVRALSNHTYASLIRFFLSFALLA